MITYWYLSKFIPHFSQVASPLRALLVLEKERAWQWHHAKHWQRVLQPKELATSAPVLAYFKRDWPVKLSVGASSKGLGAVLIQDDLPISFALRSLTSTQHNYTQIEKEMLAVVFGCTKFHNVIMEYPTLLITVYCKSFKVKKFHGFRGSIGTAKLFQWNSLCNT